jgi:hypothetical protein
LEDFNHFLIRNLLKIAIIETNRSEHRVVLKAHYVVGLPPQFGKAIARRHRHREHEPLRIAHASGAQSRAGPRACTTGFAHAGARAKEVGRAILRDKRLTLLPCCRQLFFR